jgi:glucose-6-phosphate dehydrogenase assembly protein OpcA
MTSSALLTGGGRYDTHPTPAVTDALWSEQGTTPEVIERAVRALLVQRHTENGGFVPARALNMIAFVESEYSGEIANRLRGVGRYHASRLLVLSYRADRERLDARATVASERDPAPGELVPLRETVIVELGERHLDDLVSIADPLVVSDLPTLLWSPHGHPEAVQALATLAQAVLLDSVDEPDWREAIDHAAELAGLLYVVDLAWLRSTPWRERLASTFDPPALRGELGEIVDVRINHHPASAVAGMLLFGWLASRLHWRVEPLAADGSGLAGTAHSSRHPVQLTLSPAPEQQVRGLCDVTIATAGGRTLALARADGGLHASSHDPGGRHREWTLLGASRGEAGILGEGIRQAFLRDPTYEPSLHAAKAMA